MKFSKVIIIAEAGVNHNGNLKWALKLVDQAAAAKADYIKFQIVESSMVSKYAPKAKYQITEKKENQKTMLKKFEFNWDHFHKIIIKRCKKKKIKFLTSAFTLAALQYVDKLNLDFIKIPSGEITNLPYLEKAGKLKKKYLLSTGMSSIEDIGDAIKILTNSGAKKRNITILHCNTAYPTPFSDANLLCIAHLKKKFKMSVGYSDHTLGIEAGIAAAALGAKVIEKHFTLDKKLKGPDHKSSIVYTELNNLIKAVRNIEKSLIQKEKIVTRSEKVNMIAARKSIVAIKVIKKGEILTKYNLGIKRPGSGISPMKWKKVLGLKSRKNYQVDQIIKI